ncbi:hypothetical protein BJ742DRAFT_185791 [Cladochytrium replicatum]|nr:hypothetical protein BJ742DRAFT_185791 [Cladochytrium replicatum]
MHLVDTELANLLENYDTMGHKRNDQNNNVTTAAVSAFEDHVCSILGPAVPSYTVPVGTYAVTNRGQIDITCASIIRRDQFIQELSDSVKSGSKDQSRRVIDVIDLKLNADNIYGVALVRLELDRNPVTLRVRYASVPSMLQLWQLFQRVQRRSRPHQDDATTIQRQWTRFVDALIFNHAVGTGVVPTASVSEFGDVHGDLDGSEFDAAYGMLFDHLPSEESLRVLVARLDALVTSYRIGTLSEGENTAFEMTSRFVRAFAIRRGVHGVGWGCPNGHILRVLLWKAVVDLRTRTGSDSFSASGLVKRFFELHGTAEGNDSSLGQAWTEELVRSQRILEKESDLAAAIGKILDDYRFTSPLFLRIELSSPTVKGFEIEKAIVEMPAVQRQLQYLLGEHAPDAIVRAWPISCVLPESQRALEYYDHKAGVGTSSHNAFYAIGVDFESTNESDVEELAERLEGVSKTLTDFIGALFRRFVNLPSDQYRYYQITAGIIRHEAFEQELFGFQDDLKDGIRLHQLSEPKTSQAAQTKSIKKQKSTSPGFRRAQSDEEESSSKKYLRSSADVFNRILWDSSMNASDYIVGYLDRFSGVQEIPFVDFAKYREDGVEGEDFIPFHRVRYFSRREDDGRVAVMWDRNAGIDRVFGTGVKS